LNVAGLSQSVGAWRGLLNLLIRL